MAMSESKKCLGINRKGKKCGSYAIEGSNYCIAHQDQAPNESKQYLKKTYNDKRLISINLYKILKNSIFPLIVGFVGFIINPLIMSWIQDPIYLMPTDIIMKPEYIKSKYGKGSLEIPFTVYNRDSKSHYGVWIKILPLASYETSPFLSIETTTFDQRKTAEVKDQLLCLDLYKVDGIDEKSRKAIWIIITALGSKESREFILKHNKPELINENKEKGIIDVNVVDYGLIEPIPIIERHELNIRDVEYYFKPPETIRNIRFGLIGVEKIIKKKAENLDLK